MQLGAAISIGTFDGIHLGHQAILRELERQARLRKIRSLAYVFSLPPRAAGSLRQAPALLLPIDLRLERLTHLVDEVRAIDFDAVRDLPPAAFFREVLVDELHAQVVVEGTSFRFGRGRSGTLEDMKTLAGPHGIDVIGVSPILAGERPVSSTRIRDALQAGDIEDARRCLGRPPSLLGVVERGEQLGTHLGFPTANLLVDAQVLLPCDGIYFVHGFGAGIRHPGLLYVGKRPTLGAHHVRCEVHLIDFAPRPLYGETLEVHLLHRIRDDLAFPSLDALRTQIQSDVEVARRLHAELPISESPIRS